MVGPSSFGSDVLLPLISSCGKLTVSLNEQFPPSRVFTEVTFWHSAEYGMLYGSDVNPRKSMVFFSIRNSVVCRRRYIEGGGVTQEKKGRERDRGKETEIKRQINRDRVKETEEKRHMK